MSDTGNSDIFAEEIVKDEGAYTDEHGTQADVEQEIASESTVDGTADGDAFGVPAEGEYTDEHGAEEGHA